MVYSARDDVTQPQEDEACKERLASVEDRLKNAEMETLKLQHERRNTSLERAYEDAAQCVKELEAALKRICGVTRSEEQRWALFYWKARCEYISELIATSTAEFNDQVKEISAGKRPDELHMFAHNTSSSKGICPRHLRIS
uniref:TTC3/DZIP3-like helical domain-containing protein n=1 Tax=Ascaris lumbricoides TaxID=6252 RepID=A0A9J2QA77_ASCLU